MIDHSGAPGEIDWASVYSARTLTLPRLPQRPRSLHRRCGPPAADLFGVRGANTVFQDSQSLGWHLAFVVKGLAGERLLANYSAERLGAAREIFDEAGKSTRFMTPPTPGFKLLRDAVLSLSLRHAFVRPLYHRRTSRPHEYTHSMLDALGDDDALFKAGPARGAPLRNVRLATDDLIDHLGGGGDLLYFTDAEEVPEPLRQVVNQARADAGLFARHVEAALQDL